MTKVVPICGLCKQYKPLNEFYIDRQKFNGLSTYCKSCCKLKAKGQYSRNPERAKQAMKKWRKENPERNAFIKAKSAYGISEEEWKNLKQMCYICGATTKLRIDHSHQSGRIRGMLCDNCNKGLGFFKDNPSILLRTSDYILGITKPDIFEKTYEKVDE